MILTAEIPLRGYDKVQATTTSAWDNRHFFVKKIWMLQFFSNIDMLYTVRSLIECTFRISRFQNHWDNQIQEKIDRSPKKARFLQKINANRENHPWKWMNFSRLGRPLKSISFLVSSQYPTDQVNLVSPIDLIF